MADMGFLPAVRRIVEQTSKDRQVLLFSATLDGPVAKLVADFQHDPVRHEVGPEGPDVHAAQHHFWVVDREQRVNTTADVIQRLGATIVFTRNVTAPIACQAARPQWRHCRADPRRSQPGPA